MAIIWKRPDGGVGITHLVEAADAAAEAIRLQARGDVPVDWVIAELNGVAPEDRTFRNAWGHAGGGVTVRMPEARNIWRDKMREARGPRLGELDADYMKADEAGNAAQKADIAAKRKALRDVTALPEIEAALTPQALKAVWPAILGPVPG